MWRPHLQLSSREFRNGTSYVQLSRIQLVNMIGRCLFDDHTAVFWTIPGSRYGLQQLQSSYMDEAIQEKHNSEHFIHVQNLQSLLPHSLLPHRKIKVAVGHVT